MADTEEALYDLEPSDAPEGLNLNGLVRDVFFGGKYDAGLKIAANLPEGIFNIAPINLGPINMKGVLVNDGAAALELLRAQMPDGLGRGLANLQEYIFGPGFISDEDEVWVDTSEGIRDHGFNARTMEAAKPGMAKLLGEMITSLNKQIDESPNGEIEIDVKAWLHDASYRVLLTQFFGIPIEQVGENESADFISAARDAINATAQYAFGHNFFTKGVAHLMGHEKAMVKLRGIVDNIFERSVDSPLIQHMLSYKDTDIARFYGMALQTIFAGHETVSNSAGLTYLCLAEKPELIERLRQEASEVDMSDPAKVIHHMHFNAPLLDAAIIEGLRMWPIATLLPAKAVVDMYPTLSTGQKVLIKEGTGIFFPMHAIQNGTKWTNPNDYNPDRFLELAESRLWNPERRRNADKFLSVTTPGEMQGLESILIPFSEGHRRCMGADFAMAEERLLLLNLVMNFDLVPTESSRITNHENVDFRNAIAPKEFKATLRKREKPGVTEVEG